MMSRVACNKIHKTYALIRQMKEARCVAFGKQNFKSHLKIMSCGSFFSDSVAHQQQQNLVPIWLVV
jgi:hypothetical protein